MSRPTREQLTDSNGHYQFVDLHEGVYTVTVHGKRGELTKILDMPARSTFVANFSIDSTARSEAGPVHVPRPVSTSSPE